MLVKRPKQNMKNWHLSFMTATLLILEIASSPAHAAGICFPVIHQPLRTGEKFRFEDYKDTEEDAERLRRKLLQLYPIGSSYKEIADEMKRIPCNECFYNQTGFSCTYLISITIVTGYSWEVNVLQSRGKIKKLTIYRHPLAL
jgi:hypothetical protein